jgi:hypothetical protein
MTSSSSSSLATTFKSKLLSLLLPSSIRIVFSSSSLYIILAVATAAVFWIIFNLFEQLLFFWPVWVFYLPEDAITGFILTNITAIFLAMLVSMNVYIIRHFKLEISKSLFSGTSLGILSSACISCSSIGFLLITAFGGLGIVVSNLLTTYQVPLRLISIGILLFALYSVHKRLTESCVVDYKNKKMTT